MDIKKIGIIILFICLVFVIIIISYYFITINDGMWKEGNKSNTPYTVDVYTSNVNIDAEGGISKNSTTQELWNQMLEDGCRVDEYLDGPEELQRLINAQLVTDYLDTRPNPDEAIDWETINNNIDSSEVQGIVKLKRANGDNLSTALIYTDSETFQTYIDNYNKSGLEEDKQKALSYFTLEKGYDSFGNGKSITAGTTIPIPSGLGSVHTYMAWQLITATTSMQYKLREQAGMNFDEEGFGRINGRYVIACTTTFGNVGDYIDFYQEDGSIIQCIIGDIKNQNDAGCNEWGHNNGKTIVEFVVDINTWYSDGGGNHSNPGQEGFHMEWNQCLTHAINGGSYFDNPNFGSQNVESNNTVKGLMKWPTDGTEITSFYGDRNSQTQGNSTSYRGINIAVPTGTNVYATEAGTVISAGWSDSAGEMVIIDHGNGYITKYMHNSELKVSEGDKVTKGQVIALSGNTGESTEEHLHFRVELKGTPTDPLSFKYDNEMGDGIDGIGSNIESLSTTNTFYAKVATWNEETKTVQSDDPDVIGEDQTTYTMTTTRIDYHQFVSGYQMPFDYLWALLVISNDKEFVFGLTDLVYNSEIEITVHDNLSINTNVKTDTYTKQTKVDTDAVVRVGFINDLGEPELKNEYGRNLTPKVTGESYTTTYTTITKTNTLNVSLTKANVWIVNYTQEFKQEEQPDIVTSSDDSPDDESWPETPNRTDNEDSAGIAEAFRQRIHSEYSAIYNSVTTTKGQKSNYYYRTVGRTINITNTLESTKYISSPANIDEKIEKDATEENFVTLYVKSKAAKNNISSASSWLFDILENSPNTVDMIDLTKFLLYKATGTVYDNVKEFNFDTFKPESFMPINVGSGSSGIDGVPGQIYDFLLAKGVPPVGAAAILGNIQSESSFNPKAVNESGHTGLCQWDADDRLVKLKTFASNKQAQWTDVNIQLEYMWSELETTYASVKDVIINATEESEMEYATWYFARYYEIYFANSDDFEASKNESAERYEYAQYWYSQWQENHTIGTIENINVYNEDGTVNNDAISQLQRTLEETFNLVEANADPTQHESTRFTQYDEKICTSVVGDFIGFSHWEDDRPIGKNGLSMYQCTWWANGRASMYLKRNGTKHDKYPTTAGNGGQYYEKNKSNGYFEYGSEPRPNSLVTYSNGTKPGHVAYVEAVDYVNKKYYISHAGSGRGWHGIWEMDWGEIPWSGYKLEGFIYLDSPK